MIEEPDMTQESQEVLDAVLKDGGFIQNGKRSIGLIDSGNVNKSMQADLRYSRLLQGSVETQTIDLVYEVPSQVTNVPGTPTIYFKYFEHQPASDIIVKLRESIWNQGRVPTLWIITPSTIRIYDSFARPQLHETDETFLLEELTRVDAGLKYLKDAEDFHKASFDSRAFWQSRYGRKIDRNQRVDISMLADLSKAEEILTSLIAPTLSASIAHALLGRSIFVSYLQDRSILTPFFFEKEYGCSTFKDLLNDKKATYSFFKWLRETFNGDLFPLDTEEESLVDLPHLLIVQSFLSGVDMQAYPIQQQRLWPYRFNIIPIELISSIYEMFAHNFDPKAAEARSVHYTRLQLVELVLSLAMRGISHTARVLDPACGSGIFLVEIFRRLVWLRAKEYGHPLQRDELREILHTQIFGIDIDRNAVQVAAFSLYLTLLELDPDPQPPIALKFSPLVFQSNKNHLIYNLYIQDFCNTEHIFNKNTPFVDKEFDLIIGNPPWTALTPSNAPRDPDDPMNNSQWCLDYCIREGIPDNKPDQAFMVRVRDFVKPNSIIAFIVCSRILYQQAGRQGKRWFDIFLENNTVKAIINLSDFVDEDILFGRNIGAKYSSRSHKSSTRLPASIILFQATPSAQNNKILYISPKWYPTLKKQDEIVVTPTDIDFLSQKLLINNHFLWKVAFRGTSRDYVLLSRLEELPSLNDVLLKYGIRDHAAVGITFGQGKQKPAVKFQGIPFLPGGLPIRYNIDIDTLTLFDHPTIAEKSNTVVLDLPALVVSKSLLEGRARAALVEASEDRKQLVIDQMYFGISFANTYSSLPYRVNAILNSDLAFYKMFMFSYRLGWGNRRLIEVADWLQIFFPHSIFTESINEPWDEVLQEEEWLRKHWQPKPGKTLSSEITKAKNKLNQSVFKLYELSEQEMILIEDTLRYSVDTLLDRKNHHFLPAYAPPSIDDLRCYAKRLCLQINGILKYSNFEIIAKIFKTKYPSSSCVCQFIQRRIEINEDLVTIIEVEKQEFKDVLSEISQNLLTEIADHLYIQRDLRIYEDQKFWIIKSAEKRLWSESSALNDADAIVREHMEV